MKLTEQQLREILQQKRAGAEVRSSDCLTSEQFVRAALGEMTGDERRHLAHHLVNCMDCTEEYRAVRALEPWAVESQREIALQNDASGPAESIVPRLSSSSRGTTPASDQSFGSGESVRAGDGGLFAALGRVFGRPMRPVAAAVLMLIVAGGAFVVWRSIANKQPAVSTERAGVALKLTVKPSNNAVLPAAPEELSWSALEHALTYRVQLYDFQSTPIWESPRLTGTSVMLAPEIRQQLLSDQPYYWRVIAEDAIETRQSELFQFTLAAPGANNHN
jgi:hypothetical protein